MSENVDSSTATRPVSGGCLCGEVSFAVVGELRMVSNCHCGPCRRFTGHHMAATAADPTTVQFVSDASLRWFRSAPEVEYGFCSQCGSSLFWRTSTRPELLSICAGTLDQPTGLRTTVALFTDEHGDYHQPEKVDESHPGDRP